MAMSHILSKPIKTHPKDIVFPIRSDRGMHVSWCTSSLYTSCIHPIRGKHTSWRISCSCTHMWSSTSSSDGSNKHRTNENLFLIVLTANRTLKMQGKYFSCFSLPLTCKVHCSCSCSDFTESSLSQWVHWSEVVLIFCLNCLEDLLHLRQVCFLLCKWLDL